MVGLAALTHPTNSRHSATETHYQAARRRSKATGLSPTAGDRYNQLRHLGTVSIFVRRKWDCPLLCVTRNPDLPRKQTQTWNENGLIGPKPSKSGSCNCGTLFDLAGKKAKTAELEQRMGQPDFWNNRERAQEVVVELKGLKAVTKPTGRGRQAGLRSGGLDRNGRRGRGPGGRGPRGHAAVGEDARRAGASSRCSAARWTAIPRC